MEERLTAPWHPWEAAPVALAALAASVLASVAFVALLGGVGGLTVLLTTLALQLSLIAFTIGWVAVRYPGSVPALRLRSDRVARDVVVGAWSGILLFVLAAFLLFPAINALVQAVRGRPLAPVNQLPYAFTPTTIALGALVVVLVTPVAEELFFRGFLYTGLRARFGFTVAAAISAAIFGAFHVTTALVLLPLMFVVGFGLALLYERRRSLVAPIAAHAAFNLVGYALIAMQRT